MNFEQRMGGPALQRYCCELGNKFAAKSPEEMLGYQLWIRITALFTILYEMRIDYLRPVGAHHMGRRLFALALGRISVRPC